MDSEIVQTIMIALALVASIVAAVRTGSIRSALDADRDGQISIPEVAAALDRAIRAGLVINRLSADDEADE